MSFKKLLGIVFIVVMVMFCLMLTTSYAWYSYENGSTTFNAVTSNDDIIIDYKTGDYISTDNAIPIQASEVSKYGEDSIFDIKVKDNAIDNEMLVSISLVDISISRVLQDANFKVELYYQGVKKETLAGNTIGTANQTTKTFSTNITLDNNNVNNFKIRVYLLDNGKDQNALMGASFRAKIKVDVVSRLKANFRDYSGADINISSITIDGKKANSLPTDGLYSMTSSCTKGSSLSWEGYSKTITYNSGSYVNDTCSLTFTKSTDYKLLNTVEVGSYVKYTGNNGCPEGHCDGTNANYVGDTDMGYCNSSNYKFIVNGWRIGYIQDGSAYLISAGAPECMCTNPDGTASTSSCSYFEGTGGIPKHLANLDKKALTYCNASYAYGGVCDSNSAWAMDATDFNNIMGKALSSSSCHTKYSDKSCGYANDLIDNGGHYWYATAYSSSSVNGFFWNTFLRIVGRGNSRIARGVRPVLRLGSSVLVVGGSGTYEDPYQIQTGS